MTTIFIKYNWVRCASKITGQNEMEFTCCLERGHTGHHYGKTGFAFYVEAIWGTIT